MRVVLAALILSVPFLSFAETFTGKISTVSINDTNNMLTFEVVDSESLTCLSSWYQIKKPETSSLSPSTFVLQAYFYNQSVTIHSSSNCAQVNDPAQVSKVTLGFSSDEIEALIEKKHQKKSKK